MATFKVLNSVIRMRNHGGTFMANREYPVSSAAQFDKLNELAAAGEIMLTVSKEEREAFEAELASSKPAKAEEKQVVKPVSKAKAEKEAKAKADAEKAAKAKANAPADDSEDDAEGDEDSSDEEGDEKGDI